jgi:serine protease AprX
MRANVKESVRHGSTARRGIRRSLTFFARRRLALFATIATLAVAMSGLQAPPASAGLLRPTSRVILTGPGIPVIKTLVPGLGGTAVEPLPVIGGVVADVPDTSLSLLHATPGLVVTPDLPVSFESAGATAPSRPPADVFPQTTGATQLWQNGITGKGVAVAVLDTGIDALPDFAGRLIDGVDLSGEGNPFLDSFGHGTFVAGLIAGNGVSSGGQYMGEAPGADLVAVKAAGASGATDLATIIAGVGWVVDHRVSDHIGVLNMSLGLPPITSSVLNPLDMAVEAAWHSGIAVVVSAGNGGPYNGTILSPGDDPLVITVGALDDQGTVTPKDDTIPPFSSAGPTNPDGWFKPDLVTSGRSVVSLRAPGSTVDVNNPQARIGTANFVGSGTSFSAGITSGAAALLLQGGALAGQPDSVKAMLLGTTSPGPVGNPFVDGHGALNAYAAAKSPPMTLNQTTPLLPTAMGATVPLAGTWAASTWNESTWGASTWNESTWGASTWNASTWNGSTWNGSTWNGTAWDASTWNASTWNASTWNGSAWNGAAWNASTWNASTWNESTWG